MEHWALELLAAVAAVLVGALIKTVAEAGELKGKVAIMAAMMSEDRRAAHQAAARGARHKMNMAEAEKLIVERHRHKGEM